MKTKKMIKKALQIAEQDSRRAEGLVTDEILMPEIEARGENYFDSPFWQAHEKTVKAEIKKLRALRKQKYEAGQLDDEYRAAKTQIKALQGLIL